MSEWKEKTIGDLVTFQRGHDLPRDDFKEGPYPVVGSNGIIGFHNEYTTKANGITIGRSGNIGKPVFIDINFWAHNTTLYVKKFHGSDPKFIYYFLQTLNLQNINSGSAVPTLNRNYIHPIPVIVPEINEQRDIAAILSCFDQKIDLLRRQNKTLEQIAQTLFKHWFVEFEFPNKEGQPYKSSGGEMVSSELGEIPEGWRLGKFGDEFKIVMGQSPPGESYNEKKEGMIFFQGRTDFGFRFPSIRLYTNQPKRVAKKFDILVSVRAPVGDVNIAMDDCCIGRGLSAVSSEYKSYCLYKIKSLKSIFNLFESEGTVFGALNKDNFHNIDSIIPELGVVIQFERITHPIDAKIYNNELELRNLTTIRDLLLPKLMSGQIRVNG